MGKKEFQLRSNDGTELAAISWSCDKPKGVVCLVHGFGEHAERYEHVATLFNAAQMDLIGFDLRGHGHSGGQQGHISNISDYLNDVFTLVSHVRNNYPDLPICLYGHSMGGNIVINYLLTRELEGIVCALVTSPWLRLAIEPNYFQLVLAKVGNALFPALTQPGDLNLEDISSVKRVQEDYANDPLIHNRISARLFSEINKSGSEALLNAQNLSIPVLIAHGTTDNITDHQASVEFSNKAEKATLKLWEGLRHETHNEHNQDEVIELYINWVREHI